MKSRGEASRRLFLASLGAALASSVLTACGAPAKSPGREGPESLKTAPLLSLVPSAGLNWLVAVRMRELFELSQFREPLVSMFPPDRVEALIDMTGLDPRLLSEVVIASYGASMLWLGMGPLDPALIGARFRERAWEGVAERTLAPGLTRISGITGDSHRTLVLVGSGAVAMAIGEPKLASAVEAYALGRLQSPSAFDALSGLSVERSGATIFAASFGPFDGEWSHGARGLLRAATVVYASLRVLSGGRLSVRVCVSDSSDERDEGAKNRMLSAWNDLAGSPLGRLLRLDRPLAAPRVYARNRQLSIEADLDGSTLLGGLADLAAPPL